MNQKSIAICQPTFFGWVGWFDLVDQVDVFVLLDDVAFSKQSWQQRNRIRTPSGLSYITVPVSTAGKLGQKIFDTKIATPDFVSRVLGLISQNYRSAAAFDMYFPAIKEVLEEGAASGLLADLNILIIRWLLRELGVDTPFVRSSELNKEGKRGEHVAVICEAVGGTHYVSPEGAEAYLLEDKAEFERRAIEVSFHVYEHPMYRQCFSPFVPYASVLDLVLNEGPGAAKILRSGRRPARPFRVAELSGG